jgi:hypothetical protein
MDGQVKFAGKAEKAKQKQPGRPFFSYHCASLEKLRSARVIFNKMLICSARP